jgi:recombination protein RecA
VLDLAVEYGIVDKRGAYFRYGETMLGQGRENAKVFLAENPGVLEELEYLIRREAALPTSANFDGEVVLEADNVVEEDVDF